VLEIGALDEAPLSRCLLALDYGLSHAPGRAIGRSTTVVAMLEHGLPVIAGFDYDSLPSGTEGGAAMIWPADSNLEERIGSSARSVISPQQSPAAADLMARDMGLAPLHAGV
jgi:hypothetical protein